jgi:hypothetical protein
MIGMAAKYCHGTIKLLSDKNPDQLMRPGHPTERDAAVSALQDLAAKTIGTANHKGRAYDTCSRLPMKVRGEDLAVDEVARGIHADDPVLTADRGKERRLLLQHSFNRVGRTRFGHLPNTKALQAKLASAFPRPIEVARAKVALRTGFEASDRCERNLHSSGVRHPPF